jgi:hypothetical protein
MRAVEHRVRGATYLVDADGVAVCQIMLSLDAGPSEPAGPMAALGVDASVWSPRRRARCWSVRCASVWAGFGAHLYVGRFGS